MWIFCSKALRGPSFSIYSQWEKFEILHTKDSYTTSKSNSSRAQSSTRMKDSHWYAIISISKDIVQSIFSRTGGHDMAQALSRLICFSSSLYWENNLRIPQTWWMACRKQFPSSVKQSPWTGLKSTRLSLCKRPINLPKECPSISRAVGIRKCSMSSFPRRMTLMIRYSRTNKHRCDPFFLTPWAVRQNRFQGICLITEKSSQWFQIHVLIRSQPAERAIYIYKERISSVIMLAKRTWISVQHGWPKRVL